MADVNRGNRPLSPHLTIYRPQLTSMTSILTRITGNALLVASLLMVWWFLAAAISPGAFAIADWVITSLLGDLVMLGSVWALWYHLLAGVRHLIWDNALMLDIPTAEKLGWACSNPDDATGDADVVIHASASDAGFANSIALAGVEATIVEASWYGTKATKAPLGGRFHQRRLRIIASQVGRIPAQRAARWDFSRRMRKALTLLEDPRLDSLISGESELSNLPRDYAAILTEIGRAHV